MFDLTKKKTPPTVLGELKSLHVDIESKSVHVCYRCGYMEDDALTVTREIDFTIEDDFDKVLHTIGADLNAVEDYAKIHERGDD